MPQRGGWWPDCLGSLIIAAIILTSGFFIGHFTANAKPASHYSRNVTVLISTRRNGIWVAHCHNFRLVFKHDYTFGGCLPPVHHK